MQRVKHYTHYTYCSFQSLHFIFTYILKFTLSLLADPIVLNFPFWVGLVSVLGFFWGVVVKIRFRYIVLVGLNLLCSTLCSRLTFNSTSKNAWISGLNLHTQHPKFLVYLNNSKWYHLTEWGSGVKSGISKKIKRILNAWQPKIIHNQKFKKTDVQIILIHTTSSTFTTVRS